MKRRAALLQRLAMLMLANKVDVLFVFKMKDTHTIERMVLKKEMRYSENGTG